MIDERLTASCGSRGCQVFDCRNVGLEHVRYILREEENIYENNNNIIAIESLTTAKTVVPTVVLRK